MDICSYVSWDLSPSWRISHHLLWELPNYWLRRNFHWRFPHIRRSGPIDWFENTTCSTRNRPPSPWNSAGVRYGKPHQGFEHLVQESRIPHLVRRRTGGVQTRQKKIACSGDWIAYRGNCLRNQTRPTFRLCMQFFCSNEASIVLGEGES